MTMTSEEIVRHWRQAKRQDAEELQILAELNTTGKDAVRRILEDAGEIVPQRETKLRGEELSEAIQALYDRGLSDRVIAQRSGCSTVTVSKWRGRNGLPSLGTPGRTAGEKPPAEPEKRPPAPPALPEIYGQLEAVLDALPEGASKVVRLRAIDLIQDIYLEYLDVRLGLEGERDE